ncbi:MAG: VCBS repeat-containing protein [Deltaproteobacteria bacterium]|nr:VCBS repeat-containing protein [Deltaproteobacteria bacterium]
MALGPRLLPLLVTLVLPLACSSEDAEAPDLGTAPTDVGPRDLGFLPNDAGIPDVGPNDTGVVADTGSQDQGVPADVGPSDVGPNDTGPGDAGNFTARFTERLLDNTFRHGQGGQVADLDGDGDDDVAIASSLTDTVYLYLNENRNQSWTRVNVAPDGAIVAMDTAIADFDGDGDQDIAAVGLFTRVDGFGSPGEVTWYENTGNPRQNWATRPITGLTVLWPFRVEAADLTGDGRPDLVVTLGDPSGAAAGNGVRLYPWTGSGFGPAQTIDDTLLDVGGVVVADIDGNGVLDVVAAGEASGQLAWYENNTPPGQTNGTPTFTRRNIASPPAPKFLGLANLDADPAAELVVTISRDNGAIVAYDPPADPRQPWSESTITADFGGGSTRFALADYDRDGTIDVAAASNPAGTIRVFRRVSGVWGELPVADKFGVIWILGGDFDADGRPDLITTTYEQSGTEDHVTLWRNEP